MARGPKLRFISAERAEAVAADRVLFDQGGVRIQNDTRCFLRLSADATTRVLWLSVVIGEVDEKGRYVDDALVIPCEPSLGESSLASCTLVIPMSEFFESSLILKGDTDLVILDALTRWFTEEVELLIDHIEPEAGQPERFIVTAEIGQMSVSGFVAVKDAAPYLVPLTA